MGSENNGVRLENNGVRLAILRFSALHKAAISVFYGSQQFDYINPVVLNELIQPLVNGK